MQVAAGMCLALDAVAAQVGEAEFVSLVRGPSSGNQYHFAIDLSVSAVWSCTLPHALAQTYTIHVDTPSAVTMRYVVTNQPFHPMQQGFEVYSQLVQASKQRMFEVARTAATLLQRSASTSYLLMSNCVANFQ